MMPGFWDILLVMILHHHYLAVVVDLSLSSPRSACQRDLAAVSRVLAALHGTFPNSRITLYVAAAPPNLRDQPHHPTILLTLHPLDWFNVLQIKTSKKARLAYMSVLQNRIVSNLRPTWDSLRSICHDCSALQYSLWEIFHFKEAQKLSGIIMLSDGLDIFHWRQPVPIPVVIAGTPSDHVLEPRIHEIWKGWKVHFLRRDCEPQSLIQMLKELLKP